MTAAIGIFQQILAKAQPPPGWEPIPGGQHGGYRRNVGGRYQYWYPSAEHAQRAAGHHAEQEKKFQKKLGRVLRKRGAKQEQIEQILEQYAHHSKHADLAAAHHAQVSGTREKAQAETEEKVEGARVMEEPEKREEGAPKAGAAAPAAKPKEEPAAKPEEKQEEPAPKRTSSAWLKEYPKGTTHADEEHQKVQDQAEGGTLEPSHLHELREAGHGLHDAHHDLADEHEAEPKPKAKPKKAEKKADVPGHVDMTEKERGQVAAAVKKYGVTPDKLIYTGHGWVPMPEAKKTASLFQDILRGSLK